MPSLCRDCFHTFPTPGRCPACRSPRTLNHPELYDLSIAHMDCDAFFASVEKRDRPDLADKPVIIGGGQRGVVSTACYIARI
ncbi:MAG: DNA polymerase-4, partial [Sulfitobacter sp.]